METIKFLLRISGALIAVLALLVFQAKLDEHNPDANIVCHVRNCT